jgi:hypothetical protein
VPTVTAVCTQIIIKQVGAGDLIYSAILVYDTSQGKTQMLVEEKNQSGFTVGQSYALSFQKNK